MIVLLTFNSLAGSKQIIAKVMIPAWIYNCSNIAQVGQPRRSDYYPSLFYDPDERPLY